jgi:hypothetical protein
MSLRLFLFTKSLGVESLRIRIILWGRNEGLRRVLPSGFPFPEQYPCQVFDKSWYIHSLISELVDISEEFLRRITNENQYERSYCNQVLGFMEKDIVLFSI